MHTHKRIFLPMLASTLLLAGQAMATAVTTDGFGRYQINDYLTSPSFVSGSWGPGQGTFGFDPGGTGDNTWAQFLQFDIDGNEAVFNSAPQFSLNFASDLATGGRSYTLYANAGNNNIAGAGDGFNLINNTTGVSGNVALAGTVVGSGLTDNGSFSFNSPALDSFLSSVDFDANRYVYFTLRGDTSSTAGGTVALGDSTLIAIPEPGTLVLVGLALGTLTLFRRRK